MTNGNARVRALDISNRPPDSSALAILSWAEETARSLLAATLPHRWSHVREVARRTSNLAPLLDGEDGILLRAAAWLHDVGYAAPLALTGFHPLDGARFLQAVGISARLTGLVALHSSAASEASHLGLAEQMAEFDDERTLVRDLLWYADMTVGPRGECMTFERRMEEVEERYPQDHYVVRALDSGMAERRAAVERAERWIVRMELGGQV